MWEDVMDPMRDIFKSALAGSKEELTKSKFDDFITEIYQTLGRTYNENIKEWSNTAEPLIKEIADKN